MKFVLSRSGFATFAIARNTLDLEMRDYTGVTVQRTTIARAGLALLSLAGEGPVVLEDAAQQPADRRRSHGYADRG